MGTAGTWILVLSAVTAAGQPDFRKATWGMSQTQVKATESAPPADITENNAEVSIQYGGIRLGELTGRAIYIFVNDRLVRAKYLFEAEHTERNDFIRDFRKIEPLL